ncbi:MAG: serine hydrolase [Planctomycetota bacterium]
MVSRKGFVVVALLLCQSPWVGAADAWRAQIDRLVTPLIEADVAMGVVVGIEDDRSLLVVGYGRLSAADPRVPDGRTLFEIGSISKVFTGALLVDAVQRGELKLDQPLAELLPAGTTLESKGRPVSLVDLTTHFSGLPYMPSNFMPADPTDPFADYDGPKLFAFLQDFAPTRAPGETYEYSNLAPGLLGELVSRAAGSSYEQLLAQRICAPLRLVDTSTRVPEPGERQAAPHTADNERTVGWRFAALAGCGAIHSTALDLLRFAAAQVHGDTTLHSSLRQMHTERHPIFPGRSVGIAWHLDRRGTSTRIWHNGQTGGYHAFLGVELDTRRRVVLLCNTAALCLDEVAFQLFDIAAGREGTPIAIELPATIDPAVLERYVGRYALGLGVVVTVRRDQGRLFAQLTNQNEFRLFPRSATEFFYRVVEASITFEVDGDTGKATRLILHQNGRDLPAPRLPE